MEFCGGIVALVSKTAIVSPQLPTHYQKVYIPLSKIAKGMFVADGVVIDSNWRWTHIKGEITNCYTGNEWDKEICPDAARDIEVGE